MNESLDWAIRRIIELESKLAEQEATLAAEKASHRADYMYLSDHRDLARKDRTTLLTAISDHKFAMSLDHARPHDNRLWKILEQMKP